MEKYYSINEVALMTGLTTRTIRNYIKQNVISGEKVDGVWRFTEEEFENFISNPNVRPSILAKKRAIVYDFLLDDKKTRNQICSVIDLCSSDEEASDVCQLFCDYVNECNGGKIQFAFEKEDRYIRLTICGEEDLVMEAMNRYYNRVV